VRLYRDDSEAIWIDLGDPSWRLVRVDASGWCLVDKADVPLIRPNGMRRCSLSSWRFRSVMSRFVSSAYVVVVRDADNAAFDHDIPSVARYG
jgi:hypothetical protein